MVEFHDDAMDEDVIAEIETFLHKTDLEDLAEDTLNNDSAQQALQTSALVYCYGKTQEQRSYLAMEILKNLARMNQLSAMCKYRQLNLLDMPVTEKIDNWAVVRIETSHFVIVKDIRKALTEMDFSNDTHAVRTNQPSGFSLRRSDGKTIKYSTTFKQCSIEEFKAEEEADAEYCS